MLRMQACSGGFQCLLCHLKLYYEMNALASIVLISYYIIQLSLHRTIIITIIPNLVLREAMPNKALGWNGRQGPRNGMGTQEGL